MKQEVKGKNILRRCWQDERWWSDVILAPGRQHMGDKYDKKLVVSSSW